MPHRTKVKYCSWGNVSYDVKLDIVLACYSHNEHLWFKLLNHLAHHSNSHCSANTCPAQCPQSPSVSETKLQLRLPSSMQTTTQSPPSPTRAEPPATHPASPVCNAAPGLSYAQVASQSSSSVAGLSSLQSFQLWCSFSCQATPQHLQKARAVSEQPGNCTALPKLSPSSKTIILPTAKTVSMLLWSPSLAPFHAPKPYPNLMLIPNPMLKGYYSHRAPQANVVNQQPGARRLQLLACLGTEGHLTLMAVCVPARLILLSATTEQSCLNAGRSAPHSSNLTMVPWLPAAASAAPLASFPWPAHGTLTISPRLPRMVPVTQSLILCGTCSSKHRPAASTPPHKLFHPRSPYFQLTFLTQLGAPL